MVFISMSSMFDMLYSGRFFHDENIVRQIQSTIKTHPFEYFMEATPQVVFDDESWSLFKKNMAIQAKQRKKNNAPLPSSSAKKLLVRSNNRDTTFSRIEFNPKNIIVRIDKISFEIFKFKNFEEIKKLYTKKETDDIYQIISGDYESADYFWIS